MLRGDNSERYAWVIGSDLPSLATAVFMIRDGKMKGVNIQIFEDRNPDKLKNNQSDQLNQASPILLNLLSEIPSIHTNQISVRQEIENSPEQHVDIENSTAAIKSWLEKEGVIFHPDTIVSNIKVEEYADTDEWVVSRILYNQKGIQEKKETGFEDIIVMSDARYSSELYHNLILLNDCDDETNGKGCTAEYGVTHAMIGIYDLLNLDKSQIPASTNEHPFRDAVTRSIPDIEAAAQY